MSILEALKIVAPEKADKCASWAEKCSEQEFDTVKDLQGVPDGDLNRIPGLSVKAQLSLRKARDAAYPVARAWL